MLEPVLGPCSVIAEGIGAWRVPDMEIKFDELGIPQWHTQDRVLLSSELIDVLKRLFIDTLDGGQDAVSLLLGYLEDDPPSYSYLEAPVKDGISRRSRKVHPVTRRLATRLEASVTGHDQCIWFVTPPEAIGKTREILEFLARRYSGATAMRLPDNIQWILCFADTNEILASKDELCDFLRPYGIEMVWIGGRAEPLQESIGSD